MATKRKVKATAKRNPRKPVKRKAPQPGDAIRKSLMRAVQLMAARRGLSREALARTVDDAASQMSRIMTGHWEEFSVERMIGYLTRLGVKVEIMLYPPLRRQRGRGIVSVFSGIPGQGFRA